MLLGNQALFVVLNSTWGNQLVGSKIFLIRLQTGVKLDHDADVFSQPLVSLTGELWSDTKQDKKQDVLKARFLQNKPVVCVSSETAETYLK